MGAVSGGSRVGPWASGYDPAVERSSDGQALQATSKTARIFNQELGKLNHMRQTAVANGEVVVHDRISLEFEAQGLLLSARSGEVLLLSKEVQQTLRQPATPAPAAKTQPAAEPPAEPATLKTARASTEDEPLPGDAGQQPDTPRLDTRA